jgi:hypothetical protein
MAYVRKTDTMLDDVRRNVRNMKDRELELVANNNIDSSSDPQIYRSMKNAIETAAWEAAPALKDKMPKEWCRAKREAYVRRRMADGTLSPELTFTAAEDDDLKLPPNADNWRYRVEITSAHIDTSLDKWYQEASNRDSKRDEIMQKFSTIEDQLYNFLNSHASLNAALKEMPQIELYIPQQYLDKYRQASAPRQKAERVNMVDELNIDTDALAAAAIAHRIATASGGNGS